METRIGKIEAMRLAEAEEPKPGFMDKFKAQRVKVFKWSIPVWILVGLAITSIGVSAAWISTFSETSTIQVDSVEPMLYTSNLDSQIIDVTNSSATIVDYVTLTNQNGNIDVTVTNETSIVDVDDSCTDYWADITYVVDPMNFNMTSDEIKNVTITYDIARWACPQTMNVTLNITAVSTE